MTRGSGSPGTGRIVEEASRPVDRTEFAEGKGPAYVVILGRFMTNIGFFMVIPFLAIYLTRSDGFSSFQAGILFAVLQFTRRGIGVLAGWASDRFGASRVLTLGLLIEAAAYLAFPVIGRSFWLWAIAIALLGSGGSLNNNGSRSLVAASKAGGIAANLSRYYVSINGAALIGPLIGTALVAGHVIWIGFAVAAALHLAFSAATMVLLRGMPVPPIGAIRLDAMVVGLRDRPLMLYCGLAVGGWFLITQYPVALPLTIVHQGLSPDLAGYLTSANAVAVMITVTLIGSRVDRRGTIGRLDILALSGVVLGGGWLICAFSGLGPIVAAVLVTSVGESLFCGVVDANVAGLAPPGCLGMYLGYSTMAWGLGGMLGGLIGGGFDLAANHGALPAFWVVLALLGVGPAIGVRLGRSYFATELKRREAAGRAA
ncbi:MFS transporter [Kitasatospora sp. RB6PN24]|uniref:MFS transporter n=1 Tax=Kitasatospora humi TaxID=2893891 RepID=UPI001E55D84A|nr:MFS transporter [Kitasatospora humi]MCC9308313.1 MFS transporter [Kitasatospora humi]